MSAELGDLSRRFEGKAGRRFWKSLEELSSHPQFLEFLHREFPEQASEFTDPNGRRQFMKLMGASIALAGLTGCTRQPEEKIVPYTRMPEDVIPGKPLFFASALTDRGYAKGVLVESHMGRPTKVEGNPDHPASLGATDVFGQASILSLYDPDRAQTLKQRGEISTWSAFVSTLRARVEGQRPLQGAGLRILSEPTSSPTLLGQIDAILAAFPQAKWHQWDPLARDSVRQGAVLAFGEPVETRYRLENADVILCLDADFVASDPGSLAHSRAFTARRRVKPDTADTNRLYVVESSYSLTGALADHRLPLKPSEIEGFARALASALGVAVEGAGAAHPWIAPLAKDLQAHPGRAVVMVGDGQPAAVHALAHAINQQLGAVGKTVSFTQPVMARSVDCHQSLRELVADMQGGKVDLLVILESNPVYTAPRELEFAKHLVRVDHRIRVGLYEDETSELCHWHVPAAHALESWGDARAFDGTVSLQQPLIAPLYEGAKTPYEIFAAVLGHPEKTAHDVVREHWRTQMPGDFEASWQKALHDGVVPNTAFADKAVSVGAGGAWSKPSPAPKASGLEVVFRADPSVGDGRWANCGWLQELPRPLSKLTWDNVAHLSPATARQIGVAVGDHTARGTHADYVELKHGGRSIHAPVWIQPGHPDGVVTLTLGYGRRLGGRVASGIGYDAYALRSAEQPWFAGGVEASKAEGEHILASTQDHWTIEASREAFDRHLIRSASFEEYKKEPEFAKHMGEDPDPATTLYPPFKYDGHAWGMVIDMSACVGCNACVIACVAENNIPVVGKEQVAMGREMHWLRVDRYHAGDPAKSESIETHFQPLPCMHCENAPCEVVCPVAATVHSDEGLNDMVYNRCVGTRYCSNNCPYKVRRFNFFLYQDYDTPTFKMMRNPDVTVRSRGVMEKCTYCVQRINEARATARIENRRVRDGEVTTACAQVCPGQAITFGDINDPTSQVAKLKADPRNYGLLTDLNTRPRTTYLASVRNPNPEMPHV